MSSVNPAFDAAIDLSDGLVEYRIEGKVLRFPIAQIELIGEFSAPPGVFAANYFFTFKIEGVEELIDIPAYADGIFETLFELRSYLPGLQGPKLQMSTDLDSNVMFPMEHAGEKLYSFTSEARPLINLPLFRKIAKIQRVVKGVNPKFERA